MSSVIPSTTVPRLLLVEDDPTSLAFLAAALMALPAQVDSAGSCHQAMALARDGTHDLWLIDANLPDGRGADLLARLRADMPATPAVAHTASHDTATHETLLAAGFSEVLVKPLTTLALQAGVRRMLSLVPAHVVDTDSTGDPSGDTCSAPTIPIWDDNIALTALNGQRDHVDALRGLFRDELPAIQAAVHAAHASNDLKALRDTLHRLDASCGFVGAVRLAGIVQMMRHEPLVDDVIARFDQAVRELLVEN